MSRTHPSAKASPTTPSPREYQVANGLCAGIPPKDLALQLNISIETLRKHKASLYRKLGIHKLAQLLEAMPPNQFLTIRDCVR